MANREQTRPRWMSPLIHSGMALTIGSVLISALLDEGILKTVLVFVALIGIAMSMAPFWYPNLSNWRQWPGKLLRMARDDIDLRDVPHSERKPRKEDEHSGDPGED